MVKKIVKTEAAKSRIKILLFIKKEREKYISLGHEMLNNECKKRNVDINDIITDENIEKLNNSLGTKDLDDIYFGISTLKYLPSSILGRLEVHEPKKRKTLTINKNNNKSGSGIIIAGSSDILCSLATCCNPVYGEDIVGYITKRLWS
ncbi:MAG: hypothetical protein L6V81_00680 [Clostridium sp.]|nr:MAG: hypothetical protein L6V81_00680 [Clostridium sp.]